MAHVEHPAPCGFFGKRSLRLPLCAEEEDPLALRSHFRHVSSGIAKHLQGFLQVNNVDTVSFAEDIFLHLRIAAARLMAEVNAGLRKLLHRTFASQRTSLNRGTLCSLGGASVLFCRSFAAVDLIRPLARPDR